jgi:WD40 repeat protein
MVQARKALVLSAGLALGLAWAAAAAPAEDKKENSPGAISPDNRVGIAADGKVIQATDLRSGRILFVIKGHTDTVTALTYCPDGKTFISGSKDQTIRLWDAGAGKEIRRMKGHKAAITSLVVSGDGRTLTSVSTDKKTIVWELATGKVVRQK